MRNNNIKYGNKANEKIINYLKKCKGIYRIYEVGDYQQEKWSRKLKPTEEMHNSINQYNGVDYIVITEGSKYKLQNLDGKYARLNGMGFNIVNLDTKGFNYKYKNYGKLENGIVEKMLLQVEKKYGGKVMKGWANNPKYLTTHIAILVANHIYIINYKRLMIYCDNFKMDSENTVTWGGRYKGIGNYVTCIKASVKDMIENKVITSIIPIN